MGVEGEFSFDLAPFLPFRDRAACERARRIRRGELTDHPNPEFRIALVDDSRQFYRLFAEDLVERIRAASAYWGIGPTGRIATNVRPSSRAARIRSTRSVANAV